MQAADRIGGPREANRHDRHIEIRARIRRILTTEPEEYLLRETELFTILREVFLHQVRFEKVETSRHRSVSGKHVPGRSCLTRLVEG